MKHEHDGKQGIYDAKAKWQGIDKDRSYGCSPSIIFHNKYQDEYMH